MAAAKKVQSGILKEASSFLPGQKSADLYDRWAEDYDQDLVDEWGYVAPRIVAETMLEVCADKRAQVIDLGCGTGLSGAALTSRGYECVDGLDASAGMLEQARRKGLYRSLFLGDLTAKTSLPDGAYDAAICVGAMGAGHVDASHLPEMLRVIVPGAPLVIYMGAKFYLSEDFEARFRDHERSGIWTIDRIQKSNYMDQLDRPGRLIVGYKAT